MGRSITGLLVMVGAFVAVVLALMKRTAGAVSAATKVPANAGHAAVVTIPARPSVITSPGIGTTIAADLTAATPNFITAGIKALFPPTTAPTVSGDTFVDVSTLTGGTPPNLSALSSLANIPTPVPVLDSGFGFSADEIATGSYT